MALIACKECGNEISRRAKNCPKCGAKPKRTSFLVKLLFLIFGLSILGQINGGNHAPAHVDKFAELRARAHRGEYALERTMRNPDSFKISGVAGNTKTGTICYEYRAQNGFGGMNVAYAILKGDDSEMIDEHAVGFTKLWKKECVSSDSVASQSIDLLGVSF